MKKLILQRTHESPDGTLGELTLEGGSLDLFTLEEEDRNNEVGESRVPAGTYPLELTIYHRGGYDTYEVRGVPGRSRILFHAANTEEGLAGCIAPGLERGKLTVVDEETGEKRKKIAVLHSKQAHEKLMKAMGGDRRAQIVIYDVRPDLPTPKLALVDSIHDDVGLN